MKAKKELASGWACETHCGVYRFEHVATKIAKPLSTVSANDDVWRRNAMSESNRLFARSDLSERGVHARTTSDRGATGEFVGGPVKRARKQRGKASVDGGSERKTTAALAPSTELISLVRAAEQLFSKLIALCATRTTAEQMRPPPAVQPKPGYLSEDEVAEHTRMSVESYQRARREKIGPRWINIARNVRYSLDDLVRWIESGDAAREHLSSRAPKRGKQSRNEADSNDSITRAGESARSS